MNISDLHRYFNEIVNKEQSAWYSPAEIDDYLQLGQLDVFNQYKPMYGMDTDATAALAPFKDTYQATTGNTPLGVITVVTSTEFVKLLGLMAIGFDNDLGIPTYEPVDVINDDELGERLKASQLIPVDLEHPIAVTTGKGIYQLWPKQPNTVQVDYLRLPVTPVFNFSQVGRVITYNPVGSVQLQWEQVYYPKILARALYYGGITIDEDRLIALMNAQSKEAA